MRKCLYLIAVVTVLGVLAAGCATLDPFLYKELKATDQAIKQARQAGADKECPEAFQAVVKLRDQAVATYKSCRTDEAIKMAREARQRALALCPGIADSDGDKVPDYLDKCPGTPKGVSTDSKGCPLDSDQDGVPDYLDKCPRTPYGVKVMQNGCPVDSDKDGVPDYKDKCPDTPQGAKVDNRGCPLDSDKDGVYDYKDNCPHTPLGAKVDERGCWVLKGVYFDTDKWDIKPKYYPILDEAVEVLKRNPNVRVEIQGHTDSTGGRQYNKVLSQKRAEAVMDYLIKKGIARDRLTAVGYGLSRPIAPNTTPEGRAKNRRVELWPIY